MIRRRTGELQPRDDKCVISPTDLEIHADSLLGSGRFAKVYRGTYKGTRDVAVKVLSEATPRDVSMRCVVVVYHLDEELADRFSKEKSGCGRASRMLIFWNFLVIALPQVRLSWSPP